MGKKNGLVEKVKKVRRGGDTRGAGEPAGDVNVTPEQFIEALNVDLAHEYAAVITYRTYASQVQGQWRMELRQFFEAEIPDELGHAQILADKIVTLGGSPVLTAAAVKPAKDAREMLRNALGHYGLAVELDDLIRDETQHRDEIEMILKRWDRG